VATAREGWATRHDTGVSPQPLPLAMTSALEDVQQNWTPTLASSQLQARFADRRERGLLKRIFFLLPSHLQLAQGARCTEARACKTNNIWDLWKKVLPGHLLPRLLPAGLWAFSRPRQKSVAMAPGPGGPCGHVPGHHHPQA